MRQLVSAVAVATAIAVTQLTSIVPASADPPCPCTLFGAATPTTSAFNDDDGVEVGVSFSPDTDGFVTGIRFYKGTGNTGTHYGHLWNENGDLLATTTFTSETSSGWQQANFGAAIELDANETYIASYWAPEGHYAADANFFSSPHDVTPLHATSGVYRSGVAAGFPDETAATNYWVDVIFDTGTTLTDSTAPVVSSVTPADDATGVGVTSSVVLAFSESMNASSLSLSTMSLTPDGGNTVISDIGYDPLTNIATIDPYGPLVSDTTYEIELTTGVEDAAGNNLASAFTTSFTTETLDLGEPNQEHRIFEGDTPATAATSDSNAVTLGTKFHAAIAGTVTGISFYKGTTNTGTHTGALYDEAENVLASGTFTSETADGWQTLTFSQPVLINAGQTYIAAYFAPNGHYAHESGYFANDHTAGILRVPKDGGVFRYGSSINFPQEDYESSAYWVTPVFKAQDAETDQVLFDAVTPDVTSAGDSDSVNLGLKFAPLVDGSVTGVSFYKGTGNTGTHTGSLWTTTGTQLATGTFTSETASGWQTLTFDEPVEVDANTIYVVSYLAPNGHYAYSSSYFDGHSEVRASLLAPSAEIASGNGVYAYAGSTTFPTNSFNQTNYFVTPVFRPTVDTAPSELTAAFTATPTSGSEPLTVEVDASISTEGEAAITSYAWNFGDGATGTGQIAEHVYSAGTYTIMLTVTDANNDTDTATEQITVAPAALSPSGTTRASTNTTGDDANDLSSEAALSVDGRYVAFSSFASDIVAGDGNNARDVFLRNLVTGAVTRISTSPAVAPVNGNSGGESYAPKVSADGRYVVYLGTQRATATDVVADAYLFNRLTNTTTLVSVPGTGLDPDGPVTEVAISSQGNRVAFVAFTDDEVAGTIGHGRAVFVRDIGPGTTTQLTPTTTFADGYFVTSPGLSADGRYVTFVSQDPALATGAMGQLAVYVHDLTTATTEAISVDSNGDPVTDGFSSGPSISDDGRYVAFESSSSQLVSGDDNGLVDVFVRDRTAETTIRVSVNTTADDGDGPSSGAKISGDGTHVVFTSTATNLTSADDSGIDDIFVRNLVTGTTTRATNNTSDDEPDGPSIAGSISNDGTRVAYVSLASDLVSDDKNGFTDVYVWTE